MLKRFLAIDVGERRIGVAVADSAVRIAVPYDTIDVDGDEIKRLHELLISERVDVLVVGYPRNQSGLATAQTKYVEEFVARLGDSDAQVTYQDESLTSVMAEERLKSQGKPYQKADIDAHAAAIILQDYIEVHGG